MTRRKFIRTTSCLGVLGAVCGIYAWQIEPFWLEFVHVKLRLHNLPSSLIGKTLMQISDIHVGNTVDLHFLINSLKKAKEFNPDIVVYTGDFISYESTEQFEQLEKVLNHAVHGRITTFGILGNHDYGHNWSQAKVADSTTDIIQNKGIRILRNEKAAVEGLIITGLDDFWGTNYNPAVIMNTLDPEAPNIVLAHNPDMADEPIFSNYHGWILSGHTHGGQCKPPFLKPPVLPVLNKNYTSGLFQLENKKQLYINRALGHIMQVRFNVRPEITIFELDKA